jgi:hypothetical protein
MHAGRRLLTADTINTIPHMVQGIAKAAMVGGNSSDSDSGNTTTATASTINLSIPHFGKGAAIGGAGNGSDAGASGSGGKQQQEVCRDVCKPEQRTVTNKVCVGPGSVRFCQSDALLSCHFLVPMPACSAQADPSTRQPQQSRCTAATKEPSNSCRLHLSTLHQLQVCKKVKNTERVDCRVISVEPVCSKSCECGFIGGHKGM